MGKIRYEILVALICSAGFGFAKERIKAPTDSAEKLPLKAKMAAVNALLLREVDAGEYGGTVSKLTATVVPKRKYKGMRTAVNQKVGDSMKTAFETVNRALFLKYDSWPQEKSLELGFDDKFGGKDGPSAALAYALILESLISGREIRADLACTGDMNSDQSIQPIGGVADKIRAATKSQCKYILIPEKNLEGVKDMVVAGKLKEATQIQIISVKNLDQALQVAFTDSEPKFAKALASYEEAKKAVMKGGLSVLRNPKIFEKIKVTGRTLPNHYSARLLALANKSRLPKKYSVVGSFERLDRAVQPFLDSIDRGDDTGFASHSRDDGHSLAMKNIRNIDHKLHPKMRDYSEAIETYLAARRSAATQKSGITRGGLIWNRLKKAERELDVERKKLLSDPEIKDKLSD